MCGGSPGFSLPPIVHQPGWLNGADDIQSSRDIGPSCRFTMSCRLSNKINAMLDYFGIDLSKKIVLFNSLPKVWYDRGNDNLEEICLNLLNV